MARERPRVSETCGALCAGIWLLTRMDPLVNLEVLHAVKVSAALRTAERTSPRWIQAAFGTFLLMAGWFGLQDTTIPAHVLWHRKGLA